MVSGHYADQYIQNFEGYRLQNHTMMCLKHAGLSACVLNRPRVAQFAKRTGAPVERHMQAQLQFRFPSSNVVLCHSQSESSSGAAPGQVTSALMNSMTEKISEALQV